MESHVPENLSSEAGEVITIGDAADLTEGTSNRRGSEDKRYKYH